MSDVLSPKQRSKCMSRIKSRDTKPELILRKTLWSKGYRYRVKSGLPGKPDIVFSSIKTVIFVDGCFWHRCPEHYQPPKTRAEFWENKISGNVTRDRKNDCLLKEQGWLVIRTWEHEIKESLADCVEKLVMVLSDQKAKHLPANGLLKK